MMISAYERVGGIVWVPRMLRKIRLKAEGKLHADFHANLGKGFDLRCCKFLGIDYAKLVARVLEGGTDEEIFAWCMEHGSKPSADLIAIWSEYMIKRGWRDTDVPPPGRLPENKAKAGLGARDDIMTFFDFYEVDEGRRP